MLMLPGWPSRQTPFLSLPGRCSQSDGTGALSSLALVMGAGPALAGAAVRVPHITVAASVRGNKR
ncbi:hypothetical protein AAEX63_02025 [Luteococcus sp. H138]|uniref:hypothetical protein n=1 Tax=unclassified Luteococcus TaxID=2639923 RepID=UPI00313DBAB3